MGSNMRLFLTKTSFLHQKYDLFPVLKRDKLTGLKNHKTGKVK